MALLKQSTVRVRSFKMIDSSDHISKKTSLTCTVNISKNGAGFGAAAGSVAEIANGWYSVTLTAADTGTLGDLAFYITASGADDTDFVDQVVAFDPQGLIAANVIQYVSGTASTNVAGIPKVDIVDVSGVAVSATTAQLGVNVVNWNNSAVSAPNIAGVPKVDIVDIGGAALSTSIAQVGVNVIQYASGTASTNIAGIPKVDFVDIGGVALNTSLAQLGVNVVQYASGTTSTNVAGTPKVDLVYTNGTSPTVQIKKNAAYDNFTFPMIDSSDHISLKTGLTVSGTISKDGGTFGALTNSVAELASGVYKVNLTANELNAKDIMLKFTASGGDTRIIKFVTQT